jgi:hypothetical protein
MLPAVMSTAEPAVTDDALRRIFALLETAADLLGGHAAAQWECHVQCGVRRDAVGLQRGGGRGEVLAGVDEAEIRGRGEVGAESEKGTEGGD